MRAREAGRLLCMADAVLLKASQRADWHPRFLALLRSWCAADDDARRFFVGRA